MVYRVNGSMKDGRLVLDPLQRLSPEERITSLVNAEKKPKLIHLSTPYEEMGFPIGVFNRAYEELHYLGMIMCNAATAHVAKKFMKSSQVEGLAKRYSVLGGIAYQQKQQDDIRREALENLGFRDYEKQHTDLHNGLGVGGEHTISNSLGLGAAGRAVEEMEYLRAESENRLGLGIAGSDFEEMERLRAESENSLGFGAAGSAFEEMERLRAESENRVGLGAAGSALEEMERLREESRNDLMGISAFDDMVRQRAEFDSSLGAHTARGALEAREKQQKEFERSLRAGDGGRVLENAIRDQMNLNINPFDTLINKEVNRGDGEGFQTPFKKSTFDLPPPRIPPLPKFDPPKLDKTDAVKEEEHKKHIETLAAGQKLYDLQLQAKDEQRERLNSLLEAQERIVAVQERIVEVQERMEKSSEKTGRKMFWLGMATLLAALFMPILMGLDISWGDYFSWFPKGVGWIVESLRTLVAST